MKGFVLDKAVLSDEEKQEILLAMQSLSIAQNNDELINNILNFDNEKYKKAVETFLRDKGCIEDGEASKRVVNLIKGIIK